MNQKIIGFRGWFIKENKLKSWWTGSADEPTVWTPGVNKAKCFNHNTGLKHHILGSPKQNCTCGLHGWNNLNDVGLHFQIIGIILAWGKICIHQEEGFRAQFSEIIGIINKQRISWPVIELDRMKQVGKYYKVPILEYNKAYDYAKEFGISLSEHDIYKKVQEKNELEDVVDVLLGT